MARVIDAETDALILRLIAEGKNPVAISHEAKCGAETVRKRVARWRLEQKLAVVEKPPEAVVVAAEVEPEPTVEPETKQKEWVQEGGKARGEWITQEFVETETDLIRVCKIDTARWRIVRMRIKPYQVGMKLAEKEQAPNGVIRKIQEVPHRIQLFSITADLELILPEPYLDAVPLIFAPYRESAPVFPRRPKPPRDSDVMLVVGLMDVHFGKLAWAAECGEDYDLKIAEQVFANAIDDLMERTAHLKVSRIYLPVGNDLTHIDTPNNSTTAGTIVDTDGRQAKIIATVKRSVLRGIERMMERAPVDCFGIPGNHDRLTTLFLMHIIDAYFHRTDRVQVDESPKIRKYRQLGQTLVGFTHGEHVRDNQVKSLMNLMMNEQRAELSRTRFSEWFCGHQHRTRTFEMKSTDTYQGTIVRFLQALSGTDAWHWEQGMIGSRRAAETYCYHEQEGYLGHFVATARQ